MDRSRTHYVGNRHRHQTRRGGHPAHLLRTGIRKILMSRSEDLFAQAQQLMPGGVNSPVRAFRGVGGNPPFIARGDGARIWDVEGKEYIDYVGSWGPLIFGHRPPEVLRALEEVLSIGVSFGAPTERE